MDEIKTRQVRDIIMMTIGELTVLNDDFHGGAVSRLREALNILDPEKTNYIQINGGKYVV